MIRSPMACMLGPKNALWLVTGGVFLSAPVLDHRQVESSVAPPVTVVALEAGAPGHEVIPGASESWGAVVQASLVQGEYEPSTTREGILQAPNRAHDLRTTFDERGIAVGPRTKQDTSPAWRFAWQTTGFGRPGRIEEVAPSSPSAAGARVVYQRDGWSEWYENSAKGLEQGFTVEQRPAGEGALQIIGGFSEGLRPELRADGAIDFIDDHGACVIRYGEPHTWDARGVELPSELVVAGSELAILVEDGGAAYPITVDPLMTSPAWTAESDQASALFGQSVATAGDVNGDGFSDVIVGAIWFDNGQSDEGRAFVYHGSMAGLAITPAWTAESDQAGAFFGRSVATAGDVNGDGFSDVIVGAYFYGNGQSGEGRAFVYLGSAGGVSTTAAWTAESDQADTRFGQSVATAGDVNGDGFSDVIVGAIGYDNGEVDEGRAFVYHGSASGLTTTAVWTAESNQASSRFGWSVAAAGDVNGDGFSDVIVGNYLYDNGQTDEGRAYVYHGSAGGLSTTAVWTAESNQASALFGSSVATAGDVNGDGYSDVIVGAPNYDNGQADEGRASIYHGSASGLSTTAAWTAESDQASASFGVSTATAGDVNGDGFADVIVGAWQYDNGQTDEGRASVYQGSATGLGSIAAWNAESDQAGAQFGGSAATAGDVNGDGFSDVIVGAVVYDNGQTDEGRAFVYQGSAASLSTTAAWTAESNQAFAQFGYSVSTAGDVNGDGYSDVLVGAWQYDNGETNEGQAYLYMGSEGGLTTSAAWTGESNQDGGQFGVSVATAGDVNGDGFSDVIVGALGYDNLQTDEGRAYVYLGSGAGLSSTAAWTAESDQAGAFFGASVATAGDVNGDGYSDVMVGAYAYDNGQFDEGRAFVYHGSATGLSPTADWTAESDQFIAGYGLSVATAGDVNGDALSDVIVGASRYDNGQINEGRAFVYRGSAAGLATTSAWTAEGEQIGAVIGYSVAAGDVNGDGFSDVIVGAPGYDNGQTNEGRAFVYHGSAAGLSTTAAWTAEGDQDFAEFGRSVATAGDVNGDGFSDVSVGAQGYDNGQTNEGRAFVYHGGSGGLSLAPAWFTNGGQNNAGWGWSVGTAGDVNGDGYSDIIAVADRYDNGQADEGKAWVYHGSRTGVPVLSGWSAETNQFNAQLSSAASAGDVNGDGYTDVILGSYRYDNGENDEGRTFLYLGSFAGLSPTPAWTSEPNQASAWFGSSVGSAGDVNGDGYGDVLVGGDGWDNGQSSEGRAWLYLGSAGGLGGPIWSVEGDQEGASLGYSVGTAGDVNGDGFSDVLIAVPGYDNGEPNEGVVWVFHGSDDGLGVSPSRVVEVNQAGALFGFDVSTAGDVNGDGFSDVIIGAQSYDGLQTDAGRAFVYHGGAGGLGAAPAWTDEPNQASAQYGRSVATAGDVNGDGYSDVIVGASHMDVGAFNDGAVWVYHGSPAGLAPAWFNYGGQTDAFFGIAVGTAGDVNGDGFSDVIIGAFGYDYNFTDEGGVWVFLGNQGAGLDRVRLQLRTDGTAPIDLLGRSDSESEVHLTALARTPAGRGRVRLEVEMKPAGTPFDGTGLVTSAFGNTGAPGVGGSAVSFIQDVTGLAPGTLYHWRLRIASDSPFFPRSPWLWLPYNGVTEGDVRTGGDPTTAIAEGSAPPPAGLWLGRAAPNPFTTSTELNYTLPHHAMTRLGVFNVQGRQVATLAEGAKPAGRHRVHWDGQDAGGSPLPAGVYFVRLEFAGHVVSQKIVRSR